MTAPQSDDKAGRADPGEEYIPSEAVRKFATAEITRLERAIRAWRDLGGITAPLPECGTIDMNAARKEAGNTGEFRDAIIARSGATPRTDKAAFRMRPFLEETAELVNADFARRLERDRAALIEALEIGIYDGRLQTFEDRERFRKEARETLAAMKERK